MRFATLRRDDGSTVAARRLGDQYEILDQPDVGALLRVGPDASTTTGARVPVTDADLAPLVTAPDKIICVGKNYRAHSAEFGGTQPDHPTYFAKFSRALIGARDDISLPAPEVSARVDFEGELAVVIGRTVRHADQDTAIASIAGFTVANDVSMRDWQRRTSQFLAGKTFESCTPLGPELVTPDELPHPDGRGLELRTEVDGTVMQAAATDDMVFDVATVIADLSTVLTLDPGDVILTGTPDGVGDARTPPVRIDHGTRVRVTIDHLGSVDNLGVRAR